MFRYLYVLLTNFVFEVYYVTKMNYMISHPGKYTDTDRYKTVQNVIRLIKLSGRIFTKTFGLENLPEDGGYLLIPNHQGKYDALGIIYTHKKHCSLVMDASKANRILVRQVMAMVDGLGLEIDNIRQSIGVIKEIAERVKNGEHMIIFPEGGYVNNKNHMREFKPGCFKSALMSQCPIVPVVLVDSYRAFNHIGFGNVHTQVHYLKPILYDEYKDMRTQQIADLVKSRIEEVLSQHCKSK